MALSNWTFAAAALLGAILIWRKLAGRRRRPFKSGSLVVVTGASSGIGEEIAVQAARRGCRVLLTARNVAELNRVAARCKEAGSPESIVCRAELVDANGVLNSDDIGRLAATVIGLRIPLECVVLNAGQGSLTTMDTSDEPTRIARAVMELNYFANVDLVRRLSDKIVADKTTILVMSSLSGVLPIPLRAQYCASKFAVQGFFNALRHELGPKGVGITLVCPGYVATNFHSRVQGGATAKRSGFMTAAKCAELAVDAAEQGKPELIMTLSGKLAYSLRPWLPEAIDRMISKKTGH